MGSGARTQMGIHMGCQHYRWKISMETTVLACFLLFFWQYLKLGRLYPKISFPTPPAFWQHQTQTPHTEAGMGRMPTNLAYMFTTLPGGCHSWSQAVGVCSLVPVSEVGAEAL